MDLHKSPVLIVIRSLEKSSSSPSCKSTGTAGGTSKIWSITFRPFAWWWYWYHHTDCDAAPSKKRWFQEHWPTGCCGQKSFSIPAARSLFWSNNPVLFYDGSGQPFALQHTWSNQCSLGRIRVLPEPSHLPRLIASSWSPGSLQEPRCTSPVLLCSFHCMLLKIIPCAPCRI